MGLPPFITNYIPTSAASTGLIPPPLIGPLGAVLAIPLTDNFHQDLVALAPRLDDRCIT